MSALGDHIAKETTLVNVTPWPGRIDASFLPGDPVCTVTPAGNYLWPILGSIEVADVPREKHGVAAPRDNMSGHNGWPKAPSFPPSL